MLDGRCAVIPIDNVLSLPPEEVGPFLLEETENQWFERKSPRIHAGDLAETLVAMANAEGGTIAIGLHGGRCEGIGNQPKRQNDWRQTGLDFTVPPVRFNVQLLRCVNVRREFDQLFLILVPPSDQVHTTRRDEAFLRVGDENRKLDFEQRIQLRYDKGDTTFEKTRADTYGDASLDMDAVARYVSAVGQRDLHRLLLARDLIDSSGSPLTAGQLLFGFDPQRTFPQAFVRVIRYAGIERRTGTVQNVVGDTRCEGTLPNQVDIARRVVVDLIPRVRALGHNGRFEWFSTIPEEAWLEALVNAVIHRSYGNFGDHIRIEVFDDRIEITSPGRFPGLTPLYDLMNVPRFARNPRIARVMSEMSFGQEMGEGLRRIVEAMESAGKQRPLITQSSGSVTVTLLGVEADVSELPPVAREVFQHLSRLGHASTGDLILMTNYSRPMMLRNLRLLESTGLIQRVGSSPTDPTAFWTVSGNIQRSLL